MAGVWVGCIIHRLVGLDLSISGDGIGYNNTNTTTFFLYSLDCQRCSFTGHLKTGMSQQGLRVSLLGDPSLEASELLIDQNRSEVLNS